MSKLNKENAESEHELLTLLEKKFKDVCVSNGGGGGGGSSSFTSCTLEGGGAGGNGFSDVGPVGSH